MKYALAFIIVILILIIIIYSNKYVIFAAHIYANYQGPSTLVIPNSLYEGLLVTPINPYILKLYADFYEGVKPILTEPLQNYVTFTRLGLSNSDKANCDWCSIVNGLIKLVMVSVNYHINNDINVILQAPVGEKMLNYILFALRHRKIKIEPPEINISPDSPYYERVFTWMYIYDLLEQIELRWCPFKAMRDYYRNTDKNYIPINKENIYEAGRILSTYETVECYFCNRVINEEIDPRFIATGKNSPMQEYYNHILTI
jgi:hypothetical protein